jgi:hypothetical protein
MLRPTPSGTAARVPLYGGGFTDPGGALVHGGQMNSIQLDPATRTGLTYGSYDSQIKQFSY